jgi:CubicO group peptidase (beta-lactamase class C family)
LNELKINFTNLDNFIKKQVKDDRFSGAVLVAQKGKPIFKEAYGYASKRYNIENQVDTKFNLGSINKFFTMVTYLLLKEQGKVDFDDKVGKHLPDFPKEIATKVTISHLLNHTSGLGDYFNDKFQASMGNLRSIDDFINLFIDKPLLFEPGEQNSYSNAGFALLGKIIEVITGKSYYEYVKEVIFNPLKMINTDHYELDSLTPNLATGYTKIKPDDPNKRKENIFFVGVKGSSAGGGYSTLDDMLKFDNAINDKKLLNDENSNKFKRIGKDGEGNPVPMVLAGGHRGICAFYERYNHLGVTVIILSNYDPDDVELIENKIRSLILQRKVKGFG